MSDAQSVRSAWHSLGRQLAAGRRAAGFSQESLGKSMQYSRSSIANIEIGLQHVNRAFWERTDALLGTGGELTRQYDDAETLQRAQQRRKSRLPLKTVQHSDMSRLDDLTALAASTTDRVPQVGLEFTHEWSQGVESAIALWRSPMNESARPIPFDAKIFLMPVMRWLITPSEEHPVGHGETKVGGPDIETIRQVTATYRRLDNQYGGGHIRAAVIRFLHGDVVACLRGGYDANTGRLLFSAVAEMTQLAGWASYDAGLHGLAQRYMIQALRLASGAGDRALGAEILAAMSHQAAYNGASIEAVDLARAAGRAAADAGVDAIQAEAAVLEAHGHAVGGNEAACASALSRAEAFFDRADRLSDPQWIGYFDEAYLAAKFGHCFTALGRGEIARRFATRSLDMDTQKYARGYQFNLALLAVAYTQSGEIEEASRLGILAVDAAEALNSSRARNYIEEIAKRLSKHVGLPAVREFNDRI